MNQKSLTLLMLCSLLWQCNATAIAEQSPVDFGDPMEISAHDEAEMTRGKKCKKFCCIKACSACITNLKVGTLTSTGDTPAIRSVILFASGILAIGSILIGTIPLTGLVMGFGDSSLIPVGVPVTVLPTQTGFAFTAPEAGTLFNLRASVDSVYVANLVSSIPITFTFTVLKSSCTNGSVSSYASTALTAAALTTTPAGTPGVLTPGVTGCGASSGSITVAAGDRITILVTPSIIVTPGILSTVAFSAGLEFAPAA